MKRNDFIVTFDKRAYESEFKLNDTDDMIVEYIQKNRRNIQNISIHKIASDLFMSPNSVMRTSKKLGYSGFSELKFSVQNEDNPEETRTVEHKVLDKIPQNIVRSIDVLDNKVFDAIIEDMMKANKILIAGIGDSVYFCEFFGRYLRCLNKKIEYFAQIHDIEYASKFYEKGDLVIIISSSGSPDRLTKLAKDVKERAPEIDLCCITHFGSNPLSKLCDKQLCFWGEKRIVNGYNVTDRIGLMMVIRMLCEEFLRRLCV